MPTLPTPSASKIKDSTRQTTLGVLTKALRSEEEGIPPQSNKRTQTTKQASHQIFFFFFFKSPKIQKR